MNSFRKLSIAKSVFASLSIFFSILYSISLPLDSTEDGGFIFILVVLILMLITHFILVTICLSYNVIYVQNIMNKINNDFERKKNVYTWILSTFILDIIFLVYYLIFFFRPFKIKCEDCF